MSLISFYDVEYRSNFVEFNTKDLGTKRLAFGGSLPYGEYELRYHMQNYSGACSGDDNGDTCICNSYECTQSSIVIYPYSPVNRTMAIEYCYQQDFDIFQNDPFLEEYINNAYNPAGTKCSTSTKGTYLEYKYVQIDSLGDYFRNIRKSYFSDSTNMFLIAIAGFLDSLGDTSQYYLGYAHYRLDYSPSYASGSAVAVERIDKQSRIFFNVKIEDIIRGVTVHELAHQRGRNGHHIVIPGDSDWDCRVCTMNPEIVYQYNDVARHYYNSVFTNPFFCDECLEMIRNFPEGGGKYVQE